MNLFPASHCVTHLQFLIIERERENEFWLYIHPDISFGWRLRRKKCFDSSFAFGLIVKPVHTHRGVGGVRKRKGRGQNK